MNKTILTILIILQFSFVHGQNEDSSGYKNIGINYFGELGFRPGVEIDYGFPLRTKSKSNENKRRFMSYQLHLRPSFAYYYYSHNSNNFLLSTKLNYQIRFIKNSNLRYLSLEPYLKIGYLRKAFLGEVYQTTTQGFEKKSNTGSNSLTLGGGINFGGFISKRLDWLFGMDYFIERTEDQLTLHRFVAKIGTRIKLN